MFHMGWFLGDGFGIHPLEPPRTVTVRGPAPTTWTG